MEEIQTETVTWVYLTRYTKFTFRLLFIEGPTGKEFSAV